MGSANTQATRSTLQSVDTTLSEDINATQNYIPVASTTNFSTSVVAEIESTNEVVSFADISENRLPHSKNLNVSNGYSVTGVAITTNQGPTPENTNTASKITINNAASPHTFGYFSLSIASPTAFTVSYYVKNVSGTGYVQLRSASGGKNGYFANFDIVNGIAGTTGSNINSSSITDVGNGWFRIAMTSNTTSHTLSGAEVCFTEGTSSLELPSFSGNGTDSYLIWGSQIELDNTLSTLLPTEATVPLFGLTAVTRGVNGTTAQAASSGDSIQQLPFAFQGVTTNGSSTLSENIDASQDYVPVASTSGFATGVNTTIESTNEVVSFATISENQFTFSEEFNNQPSSSRITITANDTTAPDGTTTADKLIQGSGQTNNGFVGNLNFTYLSAVYTFSVFLKNGDNNFASLDFGGGVRGWFNLSNGTIGTTTGLISSSISDEGNGWYRCSITATKSAGNSRAILYLSDADNTNDGTPGQFIFAWGAQLEQASSPSTYLPTTSSGLVGLTTVTRGVNGTTAQAALSGATISQAPSLTFLGMSVRLKAISVSPDGTGNARLTLCDNNGDALCDVDIPDAKSYTLNIPEKGIVFPNGVFVSNTDNITAYTIYTEKYSGTGLTS